MAGLTYGSIAFGYQDTELVGHDAVTDPSGTDYLYTRTTISLRAVLAAGLVPALPGENPGDTAARIEHLLMTPRQPLQYVSADGVSMIVVNSTTDAANGPTPKNCTVRHLFQGSFEVDYTVECHLITCGPATPRSFLSLRWAETTDYDDRWKATKRRTGLLVVRTGFDPDSLRGLMTPGVAKGFRRQASHYSRDETGLRITFTFLDVQLDRSPPYPATKMRGRQAEIITKNGAVRFGEFAMALEAPMGVPKRLLLAAALKVGMSRIHVSGSFVGNGGKMLADGSIVESLDDDKNEVQVTLRWRMKPVAARTKGAADATALGLSNVAISALGVAGLLAIPPTQPNAQGRDMAGVPFAAWLDYPIPGSDPNRAIGGLTRGSADEIRLIAAALNDPCGETAPLNLVEQNLYAGQAPDGGNVTFTSGGPGSPEDYSSLHADPTPGVYDLYELHAIDKDEGGTAVCPSTKTGEKAMKGRVCNSLRVLRLEWTAKRTGGSPVIPSTVPTNSNVVYVGGSVGQENVEVGADGVSLTYVVSGVYDFAYLDNALATVSAPVPPWLNLGPALTEPTLSASLAAWPFPSGPGTVNPFDGSGQSNPGGSSGGGGGGGPPVLP